VRQRLGGEPVSALVVVGALLAAAGSAWWWFEGSLRLECRRPMRAGDLAALVDLEQRRAAAQLDQAKQ
jgi:hypothetical protein